MTAYTAITAGDRRDTPQSHAALHNQTLGFAYNAAGYGAKGDGVTDDTAALQAAATAAAGGTLFIPQGTYLISASIQISANTTVAGIGIGSRIKAKTSWSSYQTAVWNGQNVSIAPLFLNVNHASSSVSDTSITIRDLCLDYGSFASGGYGGGGWHAIIMRSAQRVRILNCTFYVASCGDAVALVHCDDTLVDGCTAYDFTNCAFDHWDRPTNGAVTNCFAQSSTSNQMVNWNPEQSGGSSSGYSATNFVLTNNHFVTTGVTSIPSQIEPLGSGTTVKGVTVSNNLFVNSSLVIRGAVSGVVVSGNVFRSLPATSITSYTQNSGTPDGVNIIGNSIMDSGVTGSTACIRMEGTNCSVVNNVMSGLAGGSVGITVGTSDVTIQGNVINSKVVIINGSGYSYSASFFASRHVVSGVNNSSGTDPTLELGDLGTNGTSIWLRGNGATTPYKTIRVKDGALDVLASNAVNILTTLSESLADTETALLVRRNVGGSQTVQRVSMGIADSGGAGFKLLRVPN